MDQSSLSAREFDFLGKGLSAGISHFDFAVMSY